MVEKYPDRLTIASTGGPVTGDDQADRQIWQENTRMLEDAGAMSIEYSLSCPQGGDGTEGDIVSQNAALTAKIIGWIMEASQPQVPKLFKMTGAVTSIKPIIMAVNQTLAGFPDKKAGVTLANSFPSLAFRRDDKGAGDSGQPGWDPGIVVGMSGDGITPISYMTLANAAPLGVTISGNGGPMDYLAAANFLALGASTVQFCTLAMKYGYDIIHELCSGLSHLLQQRGIESVSQLIGRALPNPIADFMELPADKKVSCVNGDLCISCGNCTRCPYLAVSLDNDKIPKTDPSRCIGCSICVKKCVSGALYMRQRDAAEKAALRED